MNGQWSNINYDVFEVEGQERKRICSFVEEQVVSCAVQAVRKANFEPCSTGCTYLDRAREKHGTTSAILHYEFYDFKNLYMTLSANERVVSDTSCVELK